ncbi:MAG: TIGR02450 family Trp-rich protein [Polynucleobacter victoriensis]
MPVEQVVLEAVMTKRQKTIHWRLLTNGSDWKQGWVN